MTSQEYKQLSKRIGMMQGTKSWKGCQLVLVKGMTATSAAKKVGASTSTVTRPLKRLRAAQ